MLEEVLSNCTAKRLMERKVVLFGDCEAFTDAFAYLLNSKKSENISQQDEEEDQFMSTMVSTFQRRRPGASTPIKTELESFMPEPEKRFDDEINERYKSSLPEQAMSGNYEGDEEEEEEGVFSPVATRTRSNMRGKSKYSYFDENLERDEQ